VDYLPSPLDKPAVEGIDPDHPGKIVMRKADDREPLAALAFKIINDPFGKLGFVRVYSGSLKTGDTVLNPRTGKTSASAGWSRCTPTSAKTSARLWLATSAPAWE